MKFKKYLALFLASAIIMTQPVSIMAGPVKPSVANSETGLTSTQLDLWLKDLSSTAILSTQSEIDIKKKGVITLIENLYQIPPDLVSIVDNIKACTDFKGKNNTSFFLNESQTESTDTTTPSEVVVKNDNGVEIKIEDIKAIADDYNENLSNAELLFNKWGILLNDPAGIKDLTDMVSKGTDTYRLQSDIALLETSAMFSLIGNYTGFYGNSDNNAYRTIMNPIFDNIGKIEDPINPLYMANVGNKYIDKDGDGRYDATIEENATVIGMPLFHFAMVGLDAGQAQTTHPDDTTATDTEEESDTDQVTSFFPLPGVYHKGINSLYSAVSETPFEKEARTYLDTYKSYNSISATIYSKPFSIGLKETLRNTQVPGVDTVLLVNESPNKDKLFQLRALLQYLITIPEELHAMAGTPEVVKIWMNENYDSYVANTKLYQDMINMYKAFGYEDFSKILQIFLDDQKGAMDELAEAHGKITGDKPSESEETLEHNKIFDNKNYYELLAWTSAFTPFETNLNSYERALLHVSDASRDLYVNNDFIGLKRSPVYIVSGQKQTLTDIQFGNNRELNPVTLRDFMSKIETGDVMLFAQAMSEIDLDKANSMSVNNTVESNSQTGDNKSTTSVSYGTINNSTINSENFIGPVYFSTNDSNYGKFKDNSKYEKNAVKENSQSALDLLNAQAKGYDYKKYAKEITSSIDLSQHLTETYGYINYMLMHNTLQNGASKSPAVQDDLDKPLYIDFLGNILTHSGIVVIPAMSNTTYFTDITRYTLSTAMFLNSYPSISNTRGSKIVLSPGDEDKLMISLYPDKKKATTQQNEGSTSMGDTEEHAAEQGKSNGRWKWKIIGTNKDGKFDEQYNIERPNNILYKSSEDVPESITRKGVEETKMEFFDHVTGVVDVGISYSSGDDTEATESARVFTFTEFDELTIAGDGFTSKVALNSISTDPTSSDWIAIMSLNLNHLLSDKYSLFTMSTVTLGHLYSILSGCSTDVYAMSRYISLIDYEEMLKNDGLIKAFASIFESISNFFMESISSNLLTYTPTLDNLTMFKDLSLWITPVAIGFISIVVTLGLTYIFLGFFRREGFELGKVVFIFIAIPMATFYSVNLHPTLMKTLFETVPAVIMQNELLLGVADQVEGEFKTVNEYTFNNKELLREPNISMKLQHLTNREALEVRRYADENQAYLNNPLYSVQYDQNIVNVLEDKIYMRGTEYYMDIDKLFELSDVVDRPNHNYTFRLEHDVYNGYDKIAPKIPYYHIAETLTYTINSYTEGSSVAMRTLDYGHFQKGTGRAQSYFNSIFFISPGKFNEYLATIEYQHQKNLSLHLDDEETILTNEEAEKLIEEVNNLVPLSQKAMVYMFEKMGDLEDWLGIKKILGMTTNIAPFTPEYVAKIPNNEWYPVLADYTEEQILEKVNNINTRTKNFVLTELRPVLGYMNDGTAIKTVSMYAMLQFNREFGTFRHNIYPKILEPSSLNNHYISRSIYMPRIEMFSASSNSLSYYLASQGLGALIGALLDTCLRFFIYMIPILAIFLLSFFPLLLTVMYPLRNTEAFQKVVIIGKVLCIVALIRYPIVFAFKITNFASDKVGTTGGILASLAFSALFLWLINLLLKILKNKILDAYSHVIDGFQDSVNNAIEDLTQTATGRSDPYSHYSAYSSDIYGDNYNRPTNRNYNNNYNDSYSNTQYDAYTNTYTQGRNGNQANYNNYNTDGTGWREERRFEGQHSRHDRGAYDRTTSSIDGELNGRNETNVYDRTAPSKSTKEFDIHNNLSQKEDKKNIYKTDLDIKSNSVGDIEL